MVVVVPVFQVGDLYTGMIRASGLAGVFWFRLYDGEVGRGSMVDWSGAVYCILDGSVLGCFPVRKEAHERSWS